MTEDPVWSERVARLRDEFDASFAARPPAAPEEVEPLLLVRAGDERLALRLREVQALETRRRVVALPGTPDELLGLAGVRGRLVPVFSLSALLRCGPALEDGRWLVLCRDDVALAFTAFDGHASVARSTLAATIEAAAREHVDAAVRVGGATRGVVSIPSILAAITGSTRGA